MTPPKAGRFLLFLAIITGCVAATNSSCVIGESDQKKNRASCLGLCETFESTCDYTPGMDCDELLENLSLTTCRATYEAFRTCINLEGTVGIKGVTGLTKLAIELGNDINNCEVLADNEANPKCKSDADCPAAHHCDLGPGDCPKNPNTCFSALSTVQLADGTTKRMDQLQLRDSVHVGNSVYSEVYYFSTRSDEQATFLLINTQHGHSLMVTPGHFLITSTGALMTASKVVVGTSLRLGDGRASLVASVLTTQAKGLYNPHTLQGEIVVDGVLASSLTTALPLPVARALLAPLRLAHHTGLNFGQGLRGVSKSVYAGMSAGVDTALLRSAFGSLAGKVH